MAIGWTDGANIVLTDGEPPVQFEMQLPGLVDSAQTCVYIHYFLH